MKRLFITAVFVACGFIVNAQNAEGFPAPNKDSAPVETKKASLDERLNKQEQEIKTLKSDNQKLKKEVKQLRTAFPLNKRKVTVTRTGSKQVIVE